MVSQAFHYALEVNTFGVAAQKIFVVQFPSALQSHYWSSRYFLFRIVAQVNCVHISILIVKVSAVSEQFHQHTITLYSAIHAGCYGGKI